MFSSIGWPEILLVLVIIFVLFGATKLPTMAHSVGKSLTAFKKGLKETAEDVKDAIKEDTATGTDGTATSDMKPSNIKEDSGSSDSSK
jgi:sec-independent protein translocase protein TatA